ncbi:MAG: YggT family protein [Chloroflexi bacterium]|nr:YggT family protein [Chloroflexota bacterium]
MLPFLMNFTDILFSVLTYAIFGRALLSWFRLAPSNPLVRMLNDVTEPVLVPLRRVVPTLGFIDITPLVAIILLQVLHGMVRAALQGSL